MNPLPGRSAGCCRGSLPQGKPSIPAVACAPSTSGRQHLQPHRGRGASAAAASALGGARSSSSSGGLHNGARRAELTYGESIVSKLVTGTRGVDVELFGLSSSDCRRLTTSIKQAKTWQELSMLLPCTLAEWAGVDAICLTAAFSSLARVAARNPGSSPRPSSSLSAHDPISRAEIGSALRLITQLAMQRLSTFDAQGLVTMAVSLAKLQDYYSAGASSHTSVTDGVPSAAAAGHGSLASAFGSSGARALVNLSVSASSTANSPVSSSSSSSNGAAAPLPPSASPSSPSTAPPLREVIDHVLTHSRTLMPRFLPTSLANLIWALATLSYPPCGAWLTEYYRRLESQLGSMGSRDVCNILWSLCKLDLMPDVWLRDGLVERCLQAVREQHKPHAAHTSAHTSAAVPAAAGAQRVGAGAAVVSASSGGASLLPSGQDRATLIQCLARWYFLYNYRVPDEWISQYLSLVLPALGQYSAFDLVSVVHSCVVMNYQPSRRWMAGYSLFVLRSLKHDPTLGVGDLQRLMWAMSRIDYTPPLTWQREFVAATVPKLRQLNIRALTEMVWALSCWGCRPSPEWLAAYFNSSGPRLNEAQPQHISCQLSALAKLDVKAPSPWLDHALDSFVDRLGEAKAHDLVTLLDTVTVLCMDRSWLSQRTDTIKRLADTAASKFAVYDALMHTKLCLALAAANVCPAADWWKQQQAALAACLRGGDAQSQAAAQGLREVYRAWDVEVETELKPFL